MKILVPLGRIAPIKGCLVFICLDIGLVQAPRAPEWLILFFYDWLIVHDSILDVGSTAIKLLIVDRAPQLLVNTNIDALAAVSHLKSPSLSNKRPY